MSHLLPLTTESRLKTLVWRHLVTAGVAPWVSGEDGVFAAAKEPDLTQPPIFVFAQASQSLTDGLILEKAIAQLNEQTQAIEQRNAGASATPKPSQALTINSPMEPIQIDNWQSPQARFALAEGTAGRITMKRIPALLQHLIEAPLSAHRSIIVVPVSVFWGRARLPQDSWLQALTSDQRSATAGFKRLLGLLFNRGDVHVCLGKPIPLLDLASHERGSEFAARRTARLLRRRFKAMAFFTLGPDFSHRRTLLAQIVRAPGVRKALVQLTDDYNDINPGQQRRRLEKRAHKIAETIASDLTYRTLRLFRIFLSWFWSRIYSGITVHGLEHLASTNDTHTLVYVPSHRSHIDYLVLSYSLFKAGVMPPNIAAGDNLNLPLVGRLLRQGGAFFMRRSFRDDPLYAAVFDAYLHQVFSSGHSVEFFPEGGRSRSGRLLMPKYGLLKLCLEHQHQGLPKPLAFVPIYFGYEKVIEGGSYLSELQGSAKQKENLLGVLTNLRLIRQNFGRLQVNLAAPIKLDEWLAQQSTQQSALPSSDPQLATLGRAIMEQINAHASINPVNLLALVLTDRKTLTFEGQALSAQIRCLQALASSLYGAGVFTDNVVDPLQCIHTCVDLGFLQQDPDEDWFVCSNRNITLLTWYRNNVLHLFALPGLVALLIARSPAGIAQEQLLEEVAVIYPFVARELTARACCNVTDLVNAMADQGLILRQGETLMPPPTTSDARQHLDQLGSLILETLQRMYVVIRIASQGHWHRDELKAQSDVVARKLSRLFGLSGAAFSDPGLFHAFIDQLIDEQWMHLNRDQRLVASHRLVAVADAAAQRILEPPVQLALNRVLDGITPT
jgi:glycerol-3-phosphate O-acyltransferase